MIKYLVFIVIILVTACTPTKIIAPTPQMPDLDTTPCQFKTTLLDYTSNANCGYLFQLEDGTILLPARMPNVDIGFIDKKLVKIGYKSYDEEKTQTNSECGVEDKVVEITCLEEYEDLSDKSPQNLEDCTPVKNVYANAWMPEVAAEVKPKQIYEYDYSVGLLYVFKNGTVSHLYDCLGNKMCANDDGGDCESLIETLGKGRLIQVLKN